MRFENRWLTAIVSHTRDLTDGIREITLVPEGGASSFPTGSHLAVKVLIQGRQELRHYSLVGEPSATWRIAVKHEAQGRGGSRYMWSLAAGARLEVSTPESRFELQRGASHYLLIAGGIGITPILGMALALTKRGAPFRFLFAGRSRAQMAYLPVLQEEVGAALEIVADDEDARLDLAAEIARLPPDAEAYVCGPIGLLEAVRRAWRDAGRPNGKLVFETFGSSGHFASEAFTVRIPRLGKVVEVGANETMLAALEAASVQVLWDCRRGECGLCAVGILDADGRIDHRDVFYSDRQHEENQTMCACVSRIAGGSVTIEPAFRDDTGSADEGRPRS